MLHGFHHPDRSYLQRFNKIYNHHDATVHSEVSTSGPNHGTLGGLCKRQVLVEGFAQQTDTHTQI